MPMEFGQCPGANKEETEDVAVTPDSRGAEMGYRVTRWSD